MEQRRLAWPTPFETNLVTGYAPSRKPEHLSSAALDQLSGAKLELLRKIEESYYRRDGWLPPRIESITDGIRDSVIWGR
jgi:hypothetical protein